MRSGSPGGKPKARRVFDVARHGVGDERDVGPMREVLDEPSRHVTDAGAFADHRRDVDRDPNSLGCWFDHRVPRERPPSRLRRCMQSRVREGRLGFVPVRYGDEVVGGAEMLVRELAAGLVERGWEVDVLTGCARDYFRWCNTYSSGAFDLPDGARLVRFPSVASRAGPIGCWGTAASNGATKLAPTRVPLAQRRRPRAGPVRVPRRSRARVPRARVRPVPLLDDGRGRGGGAGTVRAHPVPARRAHGPAAGIRPRVPRRAWLLVPHRARSRARPRHVATEPRGASMVVGSGVAVPDGYDARRDSGIGTGSTGRFVLYAGRREAGKGFAPTGRVVRSDAAAAPGCRSSSWWPGPAPARARRTSAVRS